MESVVEKSIKTSPANPTIKKALSLESAIFIVITGGFFLYLGSVMGGVQLINTMIATAYDLLFNTAFYILAVAVLAGAFSELLTEFGIVAATNKILSPVVRPVFGLPGASMIGIFTTYLSDNPAILTFANNPQIKRYFKKYQLPALTNIGTAFGMGLIVTAAVLGMAPSGQSYLPAVVVGNIAAILGGVVSTRLMLLFCAKKYGKVAQCEVEEGTVDFDIMNYRRVRPGGAGARAMTAALSGGKAGVKLGIDIIPGILLITTLVLMLTNGASSEGYTGAAYEGIGLLPMLGEKINFILKPLFGFSNIEAISVPLTALGAAGAAIGIIPDLITRGVVNAHDISVFVAMCMCFSGYLCTHVVMMDSLKERDLTGPAILCHTIGGIFAGFAANILFLVFVK